MLSDVNKIDLSLLTSIKDEFKNEENKFNYKSYNTFKSGYIYRCSDHNIVKIKSKLESMYERISNGYSNIYDWFDEYIKTVTSLENSLASDSNSVSEAQLNNFVSSKLMNLSHKVIIDELFSDFNNKTSNFNSSVSKTINIDSKIESKKAKIFSSIGFSILSLKCPPLFIYKKTSCTAVTTGVSLIEGFVRTGESWWNELQLMGDAAVRNVMYFSGKLTKEDVEWGKKEIAAKVGNNDSKELFDLIWESDSMEKIKDNSYAFDINRQFSKETTKVAMITLLKKLKIPEEVTAGSFGFIDGFEAAYANGESYDKSVMTGTAQGTVDATQWAIGKKINKLEPFKKNFKNVMLRVGLDAVDGASETGISPFIQSIYRKGYYDENGTFVKFNSNDTIFDKHEKLFIESGSWGNVAINGLFAGLLSGSSEGVQIFKKNNLNSEPVINVKTSEKLNSSDIVNNALDKKTKQSLFEKIFIEKKNIKSKTKGYIEINNNEISNKDLFEYINKLNKELENVFKSIDLDANERKSIEEAIEYTLKKQNVKYTKEIRNRMYDNFNKGNYNIISNDNSFRTKVKNIYEPHRISYVKANEIYDEIQNIQNLITHNASEKFKVISDKFDEMNIKKGYYGIDQGIANKNFTIDSTYKSKTATDEYFRIKEKLMKDYGMSANDASRFITGIDSVGACSYASVENELVANYIDKPKQFEIDFGFPMYKEINGKKTFNGLEMIIDIYMFLNHKDNGGNLLYTSSDGKVRLAPEAISEQLDIFGRNKFSAGKQKYLSSFNDGKNVDLINKYLKSKNKNFEYKSKVICKNYNNTLNSSQLDKIKLTLNNEISNGNILSMGIYSKGGKIVFHDLNGNHNVSTLDWNEGGGHAVFITNMVEEGFIVSSWGEKFLITFDDLSKGTFLINSSKIIKNK